METIEEAIQSYLNGNLSEVKMWMQHNGVTLTSMVTVYLLDHDPSKIQIVHFISRLEDR